MCQILKGECNITKKYVNATTNAETYEKIASRSAGGIFILFYKFYADGVILKEKIFFYVIILFLNLQKICLVKCHFWNLVH